MYRGIMMNSRWDSCVFFIYDDGIRKEIETECEFSDNFKSVVCKLQDWFLCNKAEELGGKYDVPDVVVVVLEKLDVENANWKKDCDDVIFGDVYVLGVILIFDKMCGLLEIFSSICFLWTFLYFLLLFLILFLYCIHSLY